MPPPTLDDQELRVLIVGCGAIAGGYDADRPADAAPFTHAGAFTHDVRFRIAACVDPDAERRTSFMRRWAVPLGFASLAEISPEHRFDLISVCSPTAEHAASIAGALALGPRLIFCEKPLAPSIEEGEAIARQCHEQSVLLAVNHTRRWTPDIVRLRAALREGRWGELRAGLAIYSKGILHNGTHLVDLILFLTDQPLEVVWAGAPVHDFWDADPTVAAVVRAGDVAIHLAAGNAGDFAAFELQLITSRAIIAVEEGGLAWRVREAVDSGEFSGYRTLDRGRFVAGDYAEAMRNAVANIYDALISGAALSSTGDTALAAQRVCQRIRAIAIGQKDQQQQ